jgi:pyridoxal phosphate enzyme (YggS family)
MVHVAEIRDDIATRLARVHERIARAAERGGRAEADVTLVAVTKTMSADVVRAAALAGIVHVGENRVQEAASKVPALADVPALRWHLIGHLQANKARRAAELFDVIHSIDSLELAERLSRAGGERDVPVEAFAQVNVSGEGTKSGFEPEAFLACAEQLAALPHLRWRGLMTIAPAGADERALRTIFSATRRLLEQCGRSFSRHDWNALSMGMSDDFELAIEEGATHVRVGRAIFGERDTATQG